MFNLNEAFDKLRRKVPTFAYEKRLSRIETLRLAITYISFMDQVIRNETKASSSTPAAAAGAAIHHHHHHHHHPVAAAAEEDDPESESYGNRESTSW